MSSFERAIFLKGELDALRPLDNEQEARIMQKFRLDWNYHSNHLEGNSLSYGETKALILFGVTAQGKPLKDHFEITGHDEAIKWVMDIVSGDFPLTEKFIRELHVLLLKEPYSKKAITPEGKETSRMISVGKYKTVPNHVKTETGEIFYFATPEETPALMQGLVDWYRRKEASAVFPITLAAEFHYRFIRIHPFDDGNGRTARILMNFILMKHGYPPVIIKTEDKENYFRALQQADAGMFEPFAEYISQNLIRSLEIMIAGAKGESIDEPEDLDKEVALLEQRLRAAANHNAPQRTADAELRIRDEFLPKIARKFFTAFHKFDRLFETNQYHLKLSTQRPIHERTLLDWDAEVAKHSLGVKEYTVSIRFFHLKTAGFRDFQWSLTLVVELKEHDYLISGLGSFPYGQFPSEQQLDAYVKAETAKLSAAIDAFIQSKSQ